MKPHAHARRSVVAAGLAPGHRFGNSKDLTRLTLKRASELLRAGAVSPVDPAEAGLARYRGDNSALLRPCGHGLSRLLLASVGGDWSG